MSCFGSPRRVACLAGYRAQQRVLLRQCWRRIAYARQQDTGFLNRSITVNGTVYHYDVYLPMDWTPKQKWPVILFLHGSGERGSDGLDETQVGLPNALRSHYERWPFVVVMPQVPYSHHHWTDPDIMAMAMAALNAEVKEFHGDPSVSISPACRSAATACGRLPRTILAALPPLLQSAEAYSGRTRPAAGTSRNLSRNMSKPLAARQSGSSMAPTTPSSLPHSRRSCTQRSARGRKRPLLGIRQLSSQRLGPGLHRPATAAMVSCPSPLRYRHHEAVCGKAAHPSSIPRPFTWIPVCMTHIRGSMSMPA